MKTQLHLAILVIALIISSCSGDSNEESKAEEDSTPVVLSVDKSPTKIQEKKHKNKQNLNLDENKADSGTLPKSISAQHQKLLSSLDKDSKIEYSAPDFTIIKNDTLIQANNKTFEIAYTTSCLNDSLVAQEMFDYESKYKKSYVISHNYKTNISIKINGKISGTKVIQKEIFKDKLDRIFLDKSIIKHPEFVKFDNENQEAVFSFMIGVPNTDWLVLAGINLNRLGQIRIIDIVTPEL